MPRLPTTRWIALIALAFAGSLGAAWADDPPVDLHPAKPVKAAPKPPAKPAPPAQTGDPAPVSAAEAVKRANAYFDSMQSMIADFVLIGADGKRSEGKLYVQRPGRMLFQYAPPDRLEIVADGRSVAVRDQKMNTQDLYFIGQTPLKFLLADHIDIARDTKVTQVASDPSAVSIVIEDKATFGGSATITLLFDPTTFALKQWTVLDAQGLQTVVTLFNVDLSTPPDPSLFKIDEQQRMMNSNVRGGG
ncbi:MAG TPA: outer-membrane lipoprotein carrier protein LolA [Roseiarcus sp.]|nr:outer-membrane lipoprotein carrier protein LolA [Roseiarcus sp.]